MSALEAASEMLASWNKYWDSNPQLLAAILGFLVAVWQRGREHQSTLNDLRKNSEFWSQLAGLTKEEISPAPEYKSKELVEAAGFLRSASHESISFHSYRVLSKAFVIRITALDIGLDPAPSASEQRPKPLSYSSIEGIFKAEEQFSNELHDANFLMPMTQLFMPISQRRLKGLFPDLALENYESKELVGERELGDDFAFASTHLQLRMELSNIESTDTTVARTDELIHTLFSINLNLSLAYASTQLGQSWQALLVKVAPFLQGDIKLRPVVLSLASSISASIAKERRSGEIILTAHGIRLAILLALLELAWFLGALPLETRNGKLPTL